MSFVKYLFAFVFASALFLSGCSKDRKIGFLLQGSEWNIYSLTIDGQETIGPAGFTEVTMIFNFYDVHENKGTFHIFFHTATESTSFSAKYVLENNGSLLRLIYSSGTEEEYQLEVLNYEMKMEIDLPSGHHVIYKGERD